MAQAYSPRCSARSPRLSTYVYMHVRALRHGVAHARRIAGLPSRSEPNGFVPSSRCCGRTSGASRGAGAAGPRCRPTGGCRATSRASQQRAHRVVAAERCGAAVRMCPPPVVWRHCRSTPSGPHLLADPRVQRGEISCTATSRARPCSRVTWGGRTVPRGAAPRRARSRCASAYASTMPGVPRPSGIAPTDAADVQIEVAHRRPVDAELRGAAKSSRSPPARSRPNPPRARSLARSRSRRARRRSP